MKKVSVSEPKNKRMEGILSSKQEPMGLCSCCKSFQTCTFPRDSGRPILQCEEFDGIVPPHLKMVLPQKTVDAFSARNEIDPCRGLCGLCENHGTCTYPKPEGGVWHCEEYQ
ncbi:MAG TPA: hypothetical protein VLK23_07265 [Thermodesulfobacteriota bacterium]|nr:hypothetical protein [Thermodesulfobacteriota bacterium]